jgi:pantoate--beta-alanine ligase
LQEDLNMQIITTVGEMRQICAAHQRAGQTIGLVPTMGFLHAGHLSLVRAARHHNDLVVVSIFVNPTQFGVGEDYEVYPRDLERDVRLLTEQQVDYCFAPPVQEMYPGGYSTYVTVEGEMTGKLCGRSRPTHFKGVTTVVNKLFNITRADQAYFGQKDAQQVSVIEAMVYDLNLPVEIVRVPIVREADGLALSSRNVYLTPEERAEALVLSRSLQRAAEHITAGEREAEEIRQLIRAMIEGESSGVIDYVELVEAARLTELTRLEGEVLIALAVKFGSTRLIDNIVLKL